MVLTQDSNYILLNSFIAKIMAALEQLEYKQVCPQSGFHFVKYYTFHTDPIHPNVFSLQYTMKHMHYRNNIIVKPLFLH